MKRLLIFVFLIISSIGCDLNARATVYPSAGVFVNAPTYVYKASALAKFWAKVQDMFGYPMRGKNIAYVGSKIDGIIWDIENKQGMFKELGGLNFDAKELLGSLQLLNKNSNDAGANFMRLKVREYVRLSLLDYMSKMGIPRNKIDEMMNGVADSLINLEGGDNSNVLSKLNAQVGNLIEDYVARPLASRFGVGFKSWDKLKADIMRGLKGKIGQSTFNNVKKLGIDWSDIIDFRVGANGPEAVLDLDKIFQKSPNTYESVKSGLNITEQGVTTKVLTADDLDIASGSFDATANITFATGEQAENLISELKNIISSTQDLSELKLSLTDLIQTYNFNSGNFNPDNPGGGDFYTPVKFSNGTAYFNNNTGEWFDRPLITEEDTIGEGYDLGMDMPSGLY